MWLASVLCQLNVNRDKFKDLILLCSYRGQGQSLVHSVVLRGQYSEEYYLC